MAALVLLLLFSDAATSTPALQLRGGASPSISTLTSAPPTSSPLERAIRIEKRNPFSRAHAVDMERAFSRPVWKLLLLFSVAAASRPALRLCGGATPSISTSTLALNSAAASSPSRFRSQLARGWRERSAAALRLRGGATPSVSTSTFALKAAAASSSPPTLSSQLRRWWRSHKYQAVAHTLVLLLLLPVLPTLPPKAALTAFWIAYALLQMAFDAPAEQTLLETVMCLVLCNVITIKDALDGFRSEGVVAVGVMCAVSKSVQVTGGLQLVAKLLLGNPSGRLMSVLRMLLPVLAISAFLNNTPVCAMMLPILQEWGAARGVSSKQLLMPLSFATMLGGTITLIGSSTNIVAAGAAQKQDPSFVMGMFDITKVGLINAAAGSAYILATGGKLLPDGGSAPAALTSRTTAAPTKPPRGTFRLWLTLGLLVTTMTLAARQPKQLVTYALCTLCLLLRAGCMDLKDAWSAINGPVLLSIALSFALGEAIKKSDLAGIIAAKLVEVVAPFGPLVLLFAVYLVAILVGMVISNNAVVTLMFPVVVRVFEGAGIPWRPALFALTMAASASFSTPVSYQTNLMVAGAGGYAFADFLRFGLPLQLVCMLATVPACYFLFS